MEALSGFGSLVIIDLQSYSNGVIEVSWGSLLDALHLALAIHCVYAYVITGFGYAPGLTVIAWYVVYGGYLYSNLSSSLGLSK